MLLDAFLIEPKVLPLPNVKEIEALKAQKREKSNCRNPGLNRGPLDLQSNALPTELFRHMLLDAFLIEPKLLPFSNVKEIAASKAQKRKKSICRNPGLNRGHLDLQSNALPTELFRLVNAPASLGELDVLSRAAIKEHKV
ncbi:hypothetical protein KM043_011201 [Ampulex compressa]|nr:hypothetical protein KM043_011201 [Ampulex compressa]